MSERIKILLYYKYVPIDNPEEVKDMQKALCQRLDIKGRILVSAEGINGTVAGEESAINEYMAETEKEAAFNDIEWKVSWADEQVFPRLRVLVRDEIVTLGVKREGADVSLENKANYIEPEELLELYEKNADFVIVDARNEYEGEIGAFKNSITPSIDNFRDFPAFAKELEQYRDKEIVTYCTGGVRCEKASAYLRENGFKSVRQLHGGIHEYGKKVGGKYFEGEMFVFDKRLHVPVNEINPTIISSCTYCQKNITRYVDCTVLSCDALFVCCEDCQAQHNGTCSVECELSYSNPHS
jgi:UPF0176 protein